MTAWKLPASEARGIQAMHQQIEAGTHPPQSNTAFIGIGSNMGDRLSYCQKALQGLRDTPGIGVTIVSSLYETDPVDFIDQDRFYNAVIAIETCLSPQDLLVHCQIIEAELGKNIKVPKGPRTIDLDILFYNQLVTTSPGLILPHPEVARRAFVLIPLLEIAPDFVHIQSAQTANELLKQLESGTDRPLIVKRFEPAWCIKTEN